MSNTDIELDVMGRATITEPDKTAPPLSDEDALYRARYSPSAKWLVTVHNAEGVLLDCGKELERVSFLIDLQLGKHEGQLKPFQDDTALDKLYRDQRRLRARVTVAKELLGQQREEFGQAEAGAELEAEEAAIRAAFEAEERREHERAREERFQAFRKAKLQEIYGEPPKTKTGKGKPQPE